jgi:hypothetical protein
VRVGKGGRPLAIAERWNGLGPAAGRAPRKSERDSRFGAEPLPQLSIGIFPPEVEGLVTPKVLLIRLPIPGFGCDRRPS